MQSSGVSEIEKRAALMTTAARVLPFALHADEFQGALAAISRSAQNGFNKSDLENVVIPLPPIEQQIVISNRIEHAFPWIDRLAFDAKSARKLVDHVDRAVLANVPRRTRAAGPH
jgi:type I restriction enzyme S subunit